MCFHIVEETTIETESSIETAILHLQKLYTTIVNYMPCAIH